MPPITIFSFGYHGWGTTTEQLVKAVDTVEKSRGFEPPFFVDTRIRREVRAEGFKGKAFGELLGEDRHHWMKELGNEWILTRSGPPIQIADPPAAKKLLDLAMEMANQKRRVIFFCNCEWPKWEGEPACHRTAIGRLLLREATKRSVPVQVIEWPGGEPIEIDRTVSPEILDAARQGKMAVDLGPGSPSSTLLSLPWYSIVTLRSGNDRLTMLCGPAKYRRHEWCLPVQDRFDPEIDIATIQRKAVQQRKAFGLNGGITYDPPTSAQNAEHSGYAPKDRPQYTAESVYTILHSNDLAALIRSGRSGTFTEGKKWVSAKKLLQAARVAGQVVPIIFAPGEDIWELTHFAELDDLKIGQDAEGKWSTTVFVTNLTKIRPPYPNKTQLTVCSTGERLHKNHIRPYVLVDTPRFLAQKKKKAKTT
jgi:hypothetical protein